MYNILRRRAGGWVTCTNLNKHLIMTAVTVKHIYRPPCWRVQITLPYFSIQSRTLSLIARNAFPHCFARCKLSASRCPPRRWGSGHVCVSAGFRGNADGLLSRSSDVHAQRVGVQARHGIGNVDFAGYANVSNSAVDASPSAFIVPLGFKSFLGANPTSLGTYTESSLTCRSLNVNLQQSRCSGSPHRWKQ
jgi:hypothetical protein